MDELFARPAIALGMGRMKNGMGALSTRSNTSFGSSGGIAEPTAWCRQTMAPDSAMARSPWAASQH
jgi:hypothetical protein